MTTDLPTLVSRFPRWPFVAALVVVVLLAVIL